MATRDGVEKLPRGIDNKPATKQQEKLINSITKKFPETKQSIEFEDYENAPTKANASEFLSYFEENYADKIEEMKTLVRYFAERPGVEKLGSHGLFSQTDDKINLDEVADEASNHDGVVWTHVLSLHREDAERLGYNNAKAWKNLVRRNVAAILKIREQSELDGIIGAANDVDDMMGDLMRDSKIESAGAPSCERLIDNDGSAGQFKRDIRLIRVGQRNIHIVKRCKSHDVRILSQIHNFYI